MSKATCAAEAKRLTDIPNIGKAMEADLIGLGLPTPAHVKAMDPFKTYDRLRDVHGRLHDPCVLDTFISIVRFMEGAPARPWWYYTTERKKLSLVRS